MHEFFCDERLITQWRATAGRWLGVYAAVPSRSEFARENPSSEKTRRNPSREKTAARPVTG
jgi:hypothetical protein